MPVLLFKLHNMHCTPTFKTEVICVVSNLQLVKGLLLQSEWQIQYYLLLIELLVLVMKHIANGSYSSAVLIVYLTV